MGMLDNIKTLVGNKPVIPQVDAPKFGPPKKILVIEDDPALLQLYQEILVAEGFEVKTAENGQAGLVEIQKQKPDLILLDLLMPIMDGKEMLHKLRQIPESKNIPVIVLTNAGDVDSMRETRFYSNANAFLIKSNVTPEEIVKNVKTLIPSPS
jgi:CheY-like chemotaxis protein